MREENTNAFMMAIDDRDETFFLCGVLMKTCFFDHRNKKYDKLARQCLKDKIIIDKPHESGFQMTTVQHWNVF